MQRYPLLHHHISSLLWVLRLFYPTTLVASLPLLFSRPRHFNAYNGDLLQVQILANTVFTMNTSVFALYLCVHPTAIIKGFDYRCDLTKEPRLRCFVWYEHEFVVVLSRLMGETDASIFHRNALHHG